MEKRVDFSLKRLYNQYGFDRSLQLMTISRIYGSDFGVKQSRHAALKYPPIRQDELPFCPAHALRLTFAGQKPIIGAAAFRLPTAVFFGNGFQIPLFQTIFNGDVIYELLSLKALSRI